MRRHAPKRWTSGGIRRAAGPDRLAAAPGNRNRRADAGERGRPLRRAVCKPARRRARAAGPALDRPACPGAAAGGAGRAAAAVLPTALAQAAGLVVVSQTAALGRADPGTDCDLVRSARAGPGRARPDPAAARVPVLPQVARLGT